ncbi:hypothetical protein L963_243 [Leuconostoc mesenteroides subsp. cremoris T26]|nr:hypothetical protein L963_243 [Leuconostoc mesenteroides subsp. cremoris T26]
MVHLKVSSDAFLLSIGGRYAMTTLTTSEMGPLADWVV